MSGQPEADVDIRVQMLRMQNFMEELKKKNETLEQENEQRKQENEQRKQENEEVKATQAELERRVAAGETAKAMYNALGGEDLFHMDVDTLLPEMRKAFDGNEEALLKLDEWAKAARKSGKRTIAISIAAAAVIGAAAGGASLAVHAALVSGIAAVAPGPVVLIVLGGAFIVAVGVGGAIAIYKLYRMCKMSKRRKSSEKAEADGGFFENIEA